MVIAHEQSLIFDSEDNISGILSSIVSWLY